MEFLTEAFPFIFGVLLGLTCARLTGARRTGLLVGGAVALGAFATIASGEYSVSPLYFLFDMGLVGAVAIGVLVLRTWQQRRHG